MKFRLVIIEAEGPQGPVHEQLRSLLPAIRTSTNPGRPLSPRGLTVDAKSQGDLFSDNSQQQEADTTQVEPPPPDEQVSRASSGTPRRNRQLKVLRDIDPNDGPTPLRDLLAKLKVDDDSKRYLAIATWYKNHKNIDEIGPDHIFTGYKAMGWSMPEDVTGPLRKGKKSGWFVQDEKKKNGLYSVHPIGLRVAMELLGED